MDGFKEEHKSNKKRKLCECRREAVEKVVGPRSENRGLRYLCCDHFVFFGKKKNYCRFFEWVDEPRITIEEKREVQTLKRQTKGATSVNKALLEPAHRTRKVVKELENQCKTVEALQVNKENLELEIRVSENDPPQTQIHKDAADALIVDSPIPSQDSLAADFRQDIFEEHAAASLLRAPTVAEQTSNDNSLDAEHQQNSPTNAVEPETGRNKPMGTMQHNRAIVQDVQGLNLNVDDTAVGGYTNAAQIGPNANLITVLEDKAFTSGYAGKEIVGGAYGTLETPSCLCLREAVLKTVKSKGPNKGLRFWVCSNSRPFYVKKKKSNTNGGEESCKFFRWVDTPFEKTDTQKDEEVRKRKAVLKEKELALLS